MAPIQSGGGWKDLVNGGALQCLEAATLGMPFEVWKTHMGKNRTETSLQALRNIYNKGGLYSFWKGTSAKMVESASKGAVLLYSKEVILKACRSSGLGDTFSGFLAGAGGGVCQTVVMGPCTFLITAVVTGAPGTTMGGKATETWGKHGIRGFYPGGSAIAFRQATNWASRQGFTEWARNKFKNANHGGDKTAKLKVWEEACSGIIGGFLSAWNHPFEVARIEMQSAASEGRGGRSMVRVIRDVHAESGISGLFKGVVPRIGLSIWQTLFMVTGAKLVQEHFKW